MKSFAPKPWILPQPVLIIGTYDKNGKANAMNAAWGGQWDMHEIIISLGSHATTDNLADIPELTVTFATADTMVASDFVGIASGRNTPDKMERTGWAIEKAPNVNAPLFKAFPMTLECKVKQKIAGCYRLGIGSDIIPKYGIKGFYVSTLVNFNEAFIPYLEHTIELGRSFVALDYQKEVLPLVLLLRGLSDVVVRYPNIQHFIGPVSISSWYPKFYMSMIVKYVTEKHPVSDELAQMATPTTPFHEDFLKVDSDVLMQGNMDSIDKFDKFMFRLSNGQYRLPTLFKKYLKLNAKFLCFNVDPDFNDTLDSLLFLTFTDFPEDEVMPLFRDSSDEEKEIVRKRFGYI